MAQEKISKETFCCETFHFEPFQGIICYPLVQIIYDNVSWGNVKQASYIYYWILYLYGILYVFKKYNDKSLGLIR